MKVAGLVDINYKLYQKMRHEILNEKEKNIVYEEIHQWLKKRYKIKPRFDSLVFILLMSGCGIGGFFLFLFTTNKTS